MEAVAAQALLPLRPNPEAHELKLGTAHTAKVAQAPQAASIGSITAWRSCSHSICLPDLRELSIFHPA